MERGEASEERGRMLGYKQKKRKRHRRGRRRKKSEERGDE